MLYLSWYIFSVYSGFENKIKKHIFFNKKKFNLTLFFGKILIPYIEKNLYEVNFKKKRKCIKMFPGYLIIQMYFNTKTLEFIRQGAKNIYLLGKIPKISLVFINYFFYNVPLPITKNYFFYNVGMLVKILFGPFKNFSGIIAYINPKIQKVIVEICIFGRYSSVELDITQICIVKD